MKSTRQRISSAPTFHVGQRVVCVDATPNQRFGVGAKVLTRGKIYIVRAIDRGHWKAPGWGVHLEGIWVFHPEDGVQWAFHPKRFRPVTERSTDIEIFKKLLATLPTELDQ